MKRITYVLLTGFCLLSLSGCTTKAPSQEDVETAIREGQLALEDAVSKGWVSQEWADAYIVEHSVPMSDKVAVNKIGAFETTTASGEVLTTDEIEPVTFIAFLEGSSADADAYYNALTDAYDGVKKAGADLLLCIKGEVDLTAYEAAPFAVVLYDDALEKAFSNNQDMIKDALKIGAWSIDGAFLSAWYSQVTAEDLEEAAVSFVEMRNTLNATEG